MYVETDCLLALIRDEDWLRDAAETVYRKHESDLWTSHTDRCKTFRDRPHDSVRSTR